MVADDFEHTIKFMFWPVYIDAVKFINAMAYRDEMVADYALSFIPFHFSIRDLLHPTWRPRHGLRLCLAALCRLVTSDPSGAPGFVLIVPALWPVDFGRCRGES